MRRLSSSAARYREALLPSPVVWFVTLAVSASFGLVVVKVLGVGASLIVAVVAAGGAAATLLATSARVEVSAGHLQAGRARIPVEFLGQVRIADRARMSALRGRDGDARAYLCQRAWIAEGVVVEIDDPADPVPYWLISSRKPHRLADALIAAKSEPGDAAQAHSRHTG